jgi:two-component system response regulator NreC
MAKQVCRVLIVEDHTILRAGLRALLATQPNLEIVGDLGDGRQAIRAVTNLQPDLIIMDLSMPGMNGMEAIKEIKKRHAQVKILTLTVHKTDEYIRSTLNAGTDGYVLKDATHEELIMAIQYLMMGKFYLSPGVCQKVVTGYLDKQPDTPLSASWETLSHRERQILKLIAEGQKNKEIAAYLSISQKTVEKHRSNLMKKLNLHSATQLTVFAMEHGLIN